MLDLKVYAHRQQRALQTPSDKVYSPSTPAFAAQPCSQTAGPNETAWRLDTHHGDAQAADPLQSVCGVDLREVLNGCQHGGEDAEEIGPGLGVLRPGVDEVEAQDRGEDGVQNRNGRHGQRRAV